MGVGAVAEVATVELWWQLANNVEVGCLNFFEHRGVVAPKVERQLLGRRILEIGHGESVGASWGEVEVGMTSPGDPGP